RPRMPSAHRRTGGCAERDRLLWTTWGAASYASSIELNKCVVQPVMIEEYARLHSAVGHHDRHRADRLDLRRHDVACDDRADAFASAGHDDIARLERVEARHPGYLLGNMH